MTKPNLKLERVREWYLQDIRKRITQNELRKELSVNVTQLRELISRVQEELSLLHDSVAYLKSQNKLVDEGIVRSCEKGNAQSQKLFKQLTGWTEKVEIKHGLTADEYARIEQEARRLNREQGYSLGEGEVQGQPALLPEKLCLDTEQDISEDN